ncbi:MAG: acyl-CoA dehydratase activase [Dehalococcoidales bacterium]|nr:acyl-CoA dehydratase activase [Dehalococcoidales bacterium]
MEAYLGIDVGSVTTKLALLDENDDLITSAYGRTAGRPIQVIQQGLRQIAELAPAGTSVEGVGTTGSARYLAGVIVGADVVKNEITAHSVAAAHYEPDVQTVLEIGGQDSKIIIIRDGIVTDFAMNTVCAAGTGSFLDQQASRLSMDIDEFGPRALLSETPVRIAGRCTVFAESDMIHKQQMGHRVEDILYGLCQALVRNYLNNLALGKEILAPIVFQGGVAANRGMVRAFESELKTEIIVPPHNHIMGAMGAALLAHEHAQLNGGQSRFKGFGVSEEEYTTSSFECRGCSNLCEIVQIKMAREILARWGGRCGKWDM